MGPLYYRSVGQLDFLEAQKALEALVVHQSMELAEELDRIVFAVEVAVDHVLPYYDFHMPVEEVQVEEEVDHIVDEVAVDLYLP